ncbi:1D-myo-inositol 2-acetamido-2-deoxy-alpha-D-glucopyranoside deacetylase [bacterium BMS3Bbin04]|nr:1D-myo-inositol 2-acetamido-2-deoxy-alpha-D-glucopyranoside deacetylase [bacterium BMS3Bbin04]
MALDIIAIGPHPDDVELFCGGTIAKLINKGYTIGLIDMTRGEMGTRGSMEERDQEAANAARILNITSRENLGLPDGSLNARDPEQRLAVVNAIRKHQPQLVIGPAAKDRHPDHIQGMQLVEEAVFFSYVGGYKTEFERHKVHALLRYPMWWAPEADLIVDVTDSWEQRMEAVKAYRTQFHTPGVEGPKTFLASEQFIDWVEGRGSQYGAAIGVRKGEPYLLRNPVPVDDPFDLLINSSGEANP